MMIDQLCQLWYREDNLRRGWAWKAPPWVELPRTRKVEIETRVLDILRGEVRRSECDAADLFIWEGRAKDLSWLETCIAADDEKPGRNRWFHAWSSVVGPQRWPPAEWQDEHHLFANRSPGSDYRQLQAPRARYFHSCYLRAEFAPDIQKPLEALISSGSLMLFANTSGFRQQIIPLYGLLGESWRLDAHLPAGHRCDVTVHFHDDAARQEMTAALHKRDRERAPWTMHFHIEGAERVAAEEEGL
jgi:hypothetical protein